MNASHESIAKTLSHIYFADAIWYSCIADPAIPLPSLDFVVEEWPRLQAKWEAWADAATDADIARQVPFKSRFVGNAGLRFRYENDIRDRNARDQVPAHHIAKRLVLAHAIHVNGNSFWRPQQRRSSIAPIVQIRLKWILLASS